LENAIKHGIAPNPDGGWMEMTSTHQRDTLRLRVRNSAGDKTSSHKGGGVGLSNMRARLSCLYGSDAELRFGVEQGIATTYLILPRLTAPPKSIRQE
jgi:two-component system, LytTR family, sensor kinase